MVTAQQRLSLIRNHHPISVLGNLVVLNHRAGIAPDRQAKPRCLKPVFAHNPPRITGDGQAIAAVVLEPISQNLRLGPPRHENAVAMVVQKAVVGNHGRGSVAFHPNARTTWHRIADRDPQHRPAPRQGDRHGLLRKTATAEAAGPLNDHRLALAVQIAAEGHPIGHTQGKLLA